MRTLIRWPACVTLAHAARWAVHRQRPARSVRARASHVSFSGSRHARV
ncbi:hypothetical protein C7S13_5447 [Burkholderia cepacia]|nr:hypothetical protein [Burkholderia cepacia]